MPIVAHGSSAVSSSTAGSSRPSSSARSSASSWSAGVIDRGGLAVPFAVGLGAVRDRPAGRRPGAVDAGPGRPPGSSRASAPARSSRSPMSPSAGRSRDALRPRMFATLSTAWVLPGVIGPAIAGVGRRARSAGASSSSVCCPLIALAGVAHPRRACARSPPPAGADRRTRPPPPRRGRLPLRPRRRPGRRPPDRRPDEPASPIPTVVLSAVGLVIGSFALRRLTPAGTLVARPVLPAAVLLRGILTCAFFGVDAFVALTLVDVARPLRHRGGHRPDRGDDRLDGRCVDPGALVPAAGRPTASSGRFRRRRSSGSPGCCLVLDPDVPWLVGDPGVRRRRSRDGPRLLAARPDRPARGLARAQGAVDERPVADRLARHGARDRDHRRDRRGQRPVDRRAGASASPSGSSSPSVSASSGWRLTGRLRPRTVPAAEPSPFRPRRRRRRRAGRLR